MFAAHEYCRNLEFLLVQILPDNNCRHCFESVVRKSFPVRLAYSLNPNPLGRRGMELSQKYFTLDSWFSPLGIVSGQHSPEYCVDRLTLDQPFPFVPTPNDATTGCIFLISTTSISEVPYTYSFPLQISLFFGPVCTPTKNNQLPHHAITQLYRPRILYIVTVISYLNLGRSCADFAKMVDGRIVKDIKEIQNNQRSGHQGLFICIATKIINRSKILFWDWHFGAALD